MVNLEVGHDDVRLSHQNVDGLKFHPKLGRSKLVRRVSKLKSFGHQNLLFRETLDPTPDIHALFCKFNTKFFAGRLSCVELEWSVKMYNCAGICYSSRNRAGMACVIRLSEPLLKLRPRKDLVETLLHEMIHAWNFIRGIMEENGGHGQNFLSKMHEINRAAGTNISVYHTFHDEVDLYKQHWWRCDGVCKDRSPFYGFVKRTANRKPGPNDRWWRQHEQTCGGNFIKVKEPEKKTKGKENKGKAAAATPKASKVSKTSPGADIRKFFKPDGEPAPKAVKGIPPAIEPKPGTSSTEVKGGHTLGGGGNGRSRLLDMFADKAPKKRKLNDGVPAASPETIVIDDSFPSPTQREHKSFHKNVELELDDDDIIFIDDEFDDNFVPSVPLVQSETVPKDVPQRTDCNCPVCNIPIAIADINSHLDECLGV